MINNLCQDLHPAFFYEKSHQDKNCRNKEDDVPIILLHREKATGAMSNKVATFSTNAEINPVKKKSKIIAQPEHPLRVLSSVQQETPGLWKA